MLPSLQPVALLKTGCLQTYGPFVISGGCDDLGPTATARRAWIIHPIKDISLRQLQTFTPYYCDDQYQPPTIREFDKLMECKGIMDELVYLSTDLSVLLSAVWRRGIKLFHLMKIASIFFLHGD